MAFDRSRHDGLRPPLHGLGAIERREHRGHVMSVNHLRIETFRLEFQPVAFHVVLVHRRLALAQPVDVSDHGQIIEVVVRGERGRFPDLPFRQFAVAGKHVNARRALIHPRANREARAYRKSLAQRPCRGVHAMNPRRWVALELAGKLPQRHHAAKPETRPPPPARRRAMAQRGPSKARNDRRHSSSHSSDRTSSREKIRRPPARRRTCTKSDVPSLRPSWPSSNRCSAAWLFP